VPLISKGKAGIHRMMKAKSPAFDRILLFLVIPLAVVLVLKYLKQYVYLSFTLLSLKFVWVILIVLAFLTLIKKRT